MAQAEELGRWLKKRDRARGCLVLCFCFCVLKLKITFVLITHVETIIVPAFSVSPLSSVISTSVSEKRPATEKSPRPKFITEKSLWGKVASWHIRFQVRPLPACGVWDLPLQLPHCKFVICGNLRLGPQLIRGLLILNFMGGGVGEGEIGWGRSKGNHFQLYDK